MTATLLEDGPLLTPAEMPLFTNGRFTGFNGSLEHEAHILFTSYSQADTDAERDSLERRFAELNEAYPHVVDRVFQARGVRAPTTEQPAGQRKAHRLLTTNDFTSQSASGPGYIVKGLLSRQSYAVIYGAPGAGKTFTALDLAYAVAQGREWMGRKVNGGPVVYIPFEGAGGLSKRIRALVAKYGHAPHFRVIENPDYNLRENSGRQAMGQDLGALPVKPSLIVFDTMARMLRGADENSARDVSAINDAIAALIEHTGACVAVLHHSGKDKSAGARGSSALLGAVDTEIHVDGQQISSTKQRDCDLAEPIGFKLTAVRVGEDSDGDEITSCIVEPAAANAHGMWKPTGQTLDAWHALCNLAPNNEAVTKKEWSAAFVHVAWPIDPPDAEGRRKALQRAVKALVKAGWVMETPDGWQRPLTGGGDD